ncbi:MULTISPECIES: cache domain-containing protein [unclassified Roseofilum]|uniref:cache domain-containing protein n=1 Tax=unclassified Roseofilum TaxID=2620099 RepID=UPI00298E688E|nr:MULTISPECIES: cache domain-containing protein [unclassified Roseofilum]
MAVLNHQNSWNLSAKIPLKLWLIIPFVLQNVMAVGLSGWFSVRYGKKAVNEVAMQLRYEVSQRIDQKLSEYLSIRHQVNQVTLDTLELGYLQIEDFPKLQNYFIKQLQRFDRIDSVFFGSEKNEFIGIAHGLDDRLQLMRAGKATGGSIQFHWLNEQNRPIELMSKTPNFPIRDRPWYKVAVESEQEVWGPIFTYHAYPRMAIPASVAIRDEAGNLIGVLGNNFFLTQISEFLATLKIGKSGQTFILERSGNLVASSSLPQPFVIENGVAQRIHASESQDPKAIEVWEDWHPHLIWMDMRMPVMDGYAATEYIKQHLHDQSTVIIALTASVFEEEKVLVLSSGCDDFVRKPFQESVILGKMKYYLGIDYVYEILEDVTHSSGDLGEIYPFQLAIMPREWLEQLEYFATGADGEQIVQLLEHPSEEQSQLRQTIATWVNRFQFEHLVAVSEEALRLNNQGSRT